MAISLYGRVSPKSGPHMFLTLKIIKNLGFDFLDKVIKT